MIALTAGVILCMVGVTLGLCAIACVTLGKHDTYDKTDMEVAYFRGFEDAICQRLCDRNRATSEADEGNS